MIFLTDLLLLYISLIVAFYVRQNLPFASALAFFPDVSVQVYLLLGIIWGLLTVIRNRVSLRLPKSHGVILSGILLFIFSVTEYLFISRENESLSRLFIGLFLLFNPLGVASSRILVAYLQKNRDRVLYFFRKVANTFRKINNILYQYYIEVIVALIVTAIWADYILKMGLTLTSDSIVYLEAALRLSYNGELVLSSHWPPLYPISISAITYFSKFSGDGAAIISVACLVIFFFTFAILLRIFSKNSFVNVLLILLLATFNDFLAIFLNAWSEQLYTVFLISSFWFVIKHKNESRYVYFIGASVLAGMAMVTRYVGISIAVMNILFATIIAEPQQPLVRRLRKYAIPTLLSFAPLAYLFFWNQTTRGESIRYSFGYYSLLNSTIDSLKVLWASIGLPYLFTLTSLLISVFFLRLKKISANNRILLKLNIVFMCGYFALTILAFTITSPIAKTRYFSPMLFFVFLGIAHAIAILSREDFSIFNNSVRSKIAILAMVAVVLFYALGSQTLGIENTLVDRVRDAAENPRYQVREGFDLSPTAEGFRAFFSQVSSINNSNTIIVVEGDYNKSSMIFDIDSNLSKPFLSKSSIINSPLFQDFNFFEIGDQEKHISYYFDGQYKELTLVIPTRRTLRDLLIKQSHSLQNSSVSHGVFFIFNRHWFDLFANDYFQKDLHLLQFREQNEPYLIYEITAP